MNLLAAQSYGAGTAVAIGIAALIWFGVAFIPELVASARKPAGRGGIRVLAWLAFLFALPAAVEFVIGGLGLLELGAATIGVACWIVGLVWSAAAQPGVAKPVNKVTGRRAAVGRPAGYVGAKVLDIPAGYTGEDELEAVMDATAGRFRITGVDRQSRMDTTWYCEADSPANARVKGELEGIIVTAVERV